MQNVYITKDFYPKYCKNSSKSMRRYTNWFLNEQNRETFTKDTQGHGGQPPYSTRKTQSEGTARPAVPQQHWGQRPSLTSVARTERSRALVLLKRGTQVSCWKPPGNFLKNQTYSIQLGHSIPKYLPKVNESLWSINTVYKCSQEFYL